MSKKKKVKKPNNSNSVPIELEKRNQNKHAYKVLVGIISIFFTITISLYSTELRGFVDSIFGWTRLQFATDPEMKVVRSMFGHDFSVIKSSLGKDSIVVPYEGATTYQIILHIKNLSEEELIIQNANIINDTENKVFLDLGVPQKINDKDLINHLKYEETTYLRFERYINKIELSQRNELLKCIESANLKIQLQTNFKKYILAVNCIWFHNGDRYSIIGTDTNIANFEYNDSEGVKVGGLLTQQPLQWPNFK
ncbi:MAG: hypothetical protein HY960_07260 [Ignavibacteriae bacterium]|nr:hypothetical protein [Ignavibacteriota bacterium]